MRRPVLVVTVELDNSNDAGTAASNDDTDVCECGMAASNECEFGYSGSCAIIGVAVAILTAVDGDGYDRVGATDDEAARGGTDARHAGAAFCVGTGARDDDAAFIDDTGARDNDAASRDGTGARGDMRLSVTLLAREVTMRLSLAIQLPENVVGASDDETSTRDGGASTREGEIGSSSRHE